MKQLIAHHKKKRKDLATQYIKELKLTIKNEQARHHERIRKLKLASGVGAGIAVGSIMGLGMGSMGASVLGITSATTGARIGAGVMSILGAKTGYESNKPQKITHPTLYFAKLHARDLRKAGQKVKRIGKDLIINL